MRRAILIDEPPEIDVGVTLGRRELGVAEKFLNPAQIGARREKMGGERMTKPVGGNRSARRDPDQVLR